MSEQITPSDKKEKKVDMKYQGGSGDTVYGLGLIGAWVYYIGRATTPEERVKGFFKGLVWPAFLVYDLFKFLNKE